MLTGKDIQAHTQKGNTKLPKSTLIFNMGPAHDCPSDKLGLCVNSEICYAKKAETQYSACQPYRDRQSDIWLNNNAHDLAEAFYHYVKRNNSNSQAIKITKLRFNESGDFYGTDCINKLETISRRLEELGVIVYGYTARHDLSFANTSFRVRGSNFMLDGEFRTVTEPSGKNPVCPGDCKKCSLCSSLATVVEVVAH